MVKIPTKTSGFSQTAIIIMCAVFIMNLFLSRDYNLFWILLSGGGKTVDYLGESYTYVLQDFQLYRIITCGYTDTAIWHLAENALAIWYVGLYLENRIGILRMMFVYHMGLIIAGIAILVLYPNSFHYGASPAIFACLGMLANWFMRKKDLWDEYKSQKGFYFLLYYFVLSNLLGMCTLLFHLLGFCTGFLLGFVMNEN